MLTSMFYYEHYRPYILKTAGLSGSKLEAPKKKLAVSDGKDDLPAEVALNKSLNRDVINYAKGIYKNTTDLKYASKKLSYDIKNYNKFKDRDEFDQDVFEKSFQEDLSRFAGSYNKSYQFLKNQQHSPYLGEAADKLDSATEHSRKILSVMGISKTEDGELTINTEENTFWDGKNTARKGEAAERLFSKVNEQTTDILDYPMAKHMNFKSLNYYYNYDVDDVQVDSFQIIKTGLLVNIAL